MSNTFIDVFGYESSLCDLSDSRIYDYTTNNGVSGVSGVIAKTAISFNYPDWHEIYSYNGLVIYVKIANNRLNAKATINNKSVEYEMTYSVPVAVYLGFLWDETANGKLIFLSNTNNESSPYWFCGGLIKQGSVNIASDLYTWIVNNPYDPNKSGGAGSGYIGNSLLSNKKMVGFNVPTSSAESTKTESVNEASETPVANKPKIGNGFARIKFLRDVQTVRKSLIVNNTYNSEIMPDGIDIDSNKEVYNSYETNTGLNDFNSRFSQYFLSNKTLVAHMKNSQAYTLTNDGIFRRNAGNNYYTEINEWIPIKRIYNPKTLYFKHQDYHEYGSNFFGEIRCVYIQNGVAYGSNSVRVDSSSSWADGSLDISNLPYVDYIWILWEDADEDFKDFEIEYLA